MSFPYQYYSENYHFGRAGFLPMIWFRNQYRQDETDSCTHRGQLFTRT